ncbi:cytochrome c [Rhodoferax sp.]|uniref:c-type cytochrome n=1 Tax=Rhodoferax sp. TaxID=50421 RepID=UPI002717A04E|nr:cytochrome c [Rhodoferax sp.]MDO8319599.1 cytochrome c [Rhodoferax sp.]
MTPKKFKTYQRPVRQLAIAIAVASLAACGGGGGGGTGLAGLGASPTGTLSGVAVDGYLQGATVFLDLNSNGLQDTGEPSSLTNTTGQYVLDYSQLSTPIAGLQIVVTGGIDTDTGNTFTGRLTARASKAAQGQVVTPLTSLVDAMVAQGLAADVTAAQTMVATALGLTVADLSKDPVAALASTPAIYTQAVALQRAVQLLAGVNANSGESSHKAQERMMKAIAKVVKSQTSRVDVSQLVAALQVTNTSGASQLAAAVQAAVTTALNNGGHDSAKAALKGLDQVRVRMENDHDDHDKNHDDDMEQAAAKIDDERGLSTSRPFTNLVKDESNKDEIDAVKNLFQPGNVVAQPVNTNGRLLASNCFQCHGTGGMGGFESIRGDAGEVRDYLTKPASSDIMAAHAQGYTSAQLDAIIAYLQQ